MVTVIPLQPIVALLVYRSEGAFELHVDGEIDDVVRIALPPHSDEAHTRLAIAIPQERGGHGDTPGFRLQASGSTRGDARKGQGPNREP